MRHSAEDWQGSGHHQVQRCYPPVSQYLLYKLGEKFSEKLLKPQQLLPSTQANSI